MNDLPSTADQANRPANGLVLHDYWRSGAAYRVRIGLHLKGLAFEQVPVNLLTGEHRGADYRRLNPQGLAPTLIAGGAALTQSGAILEWLEETYPDPAILPAGVNDRAIVRAMAAIIGADIHPIHNLRVLNVLRGEMGQDDTAVNAWIGRWISEGFAALEVLIARHGGTFSFGDTPTIADCFLTPQVYSANRFAVDLAPYPNLVRVAQHAAHHPAFQAADPARQPGAPA